jgi:hypothetical protein
MAKAPVIKPVSAAEDALAEVAAAKETSTSFDARKPDETSPCTRSHILNARTSKTLRDADTGKNLAHFVDEDDLFRKLGINLGAEE